MTTPNIAILLAGILSLAATATVSAGDHWSAQTMRPLKATSLDTGGAHVVSYFQKTDGACRLTMMMASEATGAATRIQTMVAPGRTARVDDADGKSSLFTCLGNADAMNVLRTDRVATRASRSGV